ncbi:hypothetical protein D0Y60_15565 [Shinella sp. WSJ-2]|nr:hypothetical protein D0Y60_15565 [Shinella sp. WSJ-2]
MHSVDAHGGFPPSAAASAVPLWRFFDLHTSMGRGFAGPFFLPAPGAVRKWRVLNRAIKCNLVVVLALSSRSYAPIPVADVMVRCLDFRAMSRPGMRI